MAYATKQDIIDIYGQDEVDITFDRNGDGAAEDNTVAKCLERASCEIDAYLAAQHQLPIAPPPQLLKYLCVDMALYAGSMDLGSLTEDRRKRYEDAASLLKMISTGEASLGI